MIEEKLIAKEENLLRLASHRVQLGGQERRLMDKIKKILGEQPLAPPDLKEIEKQAGVPRPRLNEVIRLLERDGSWSGSPLTCIFWRAASNDCVRPLKEYLLEKGEMTAASFRDLIGSSRKYTIPLLEYFDRDGLTIGSATFAASNLSPATDRSRTAR